MGKPRRHPAAGRLGPAAQQRHQGVVGRAGSQQHHQPGGDSSQPMRLLGLRLMITESTTVQARNAE